MADSIKLTTVTNSIAALSITITKPDGTSGTLTIRDIDELTEAINQEQCPILSPQPANFVTDVVITRDTFGADAALKTVKYTLHYIFYYAPVAQGATMFEKYDNMITAAAIILNHLAINTNLTGATDILPQAIPVFGPVADGTGALFHGCVISMRVMQYMEA